MITIPDTRMLGQTSKGDINHMTYKNAERQPERNLNANIERPMGKTKQIKHHLLTSCLKKK